MGTRLRPITDSIPKCLVPIHGRPLLDYWFDLLFDAGVDRILVNTHYLADTVTRHVASSPFADRVDLVYEETLLGTGGTVVANHAYFGSEPLLLAHADNLTDFDVAGLLAAHRSRPPVVAMTMLAFRTDTPQSCGILELDERNLVRAFHEKVANPPGNLANAAVYILESEVVERAAALGKSVIDLQTELIPGFLCRILAVETNGYHRDIGTPESLQLANLEFKPLRPKPNQAR
jgi:mannose-1-phosphate guanylyltransferase